MSALRIFFIAINGNFKFNARILDSRKSVHDGISVECTEFVKIETADASFYD